MDESSQNALLRAAQLNNVNKDDLKQLLKKVNINSTKYAGETWLHISVSYNNKLLLNVLLDEGANVNAVDNHGNTVLHLSVEQNNKNILTRLLDTKINVDLKNVWGYTAYELALRDNYLDSACMLLEITSQKNVPVNGEMLIHIVVTQRRTDLLQRHIKNGASLLIKNHRRMTVLQLAALNSYDIEVRMILTSEIKGRIRKRSAKALFVSILRRNKRSFKKLLNTGNCDVNHTDSTGRTALQWAVLSRFSFGVDMLLTKGAEVNKQDILKNTALHLAVLINDTHILNKLLSNGADVNLQDEDGRTALHFATYLNDHQSNHTGHHLAANLDVDQSNHSISLTIARLVKAGSLLDLQDYDGNTALNLAVKNDNSIAVNALLIWGAGIGSGKLFVISSIREIFFNHKLLLKGAGLETYNFGLNSYEFERLSHHFDTQRSSRSDNYDNEVKAMVNFKIANIRLYDVLTLKTPSFVKSDELKSIIFSNSVKDNYPNYWHMLQASFSRSEVKYQRLEKCISLPLFTTVSNGNEVHLPVELKLMIFSLLPDEDLFSFIKAIDSCG